MTTPQITIEQALELAVWHHQAGRLGQAELLYREFLAAQPENADALNGLGLVAYQSGEKTIAIDLIGRAVAIRPKWAEGFSNLGVVLRDAARRDDAIDAFRRAIALNPNLPGGHYNLAQTLLDAKELDAAIAAYRQSVALSPGHADAHSGLGNALRAAGRLDEALAAYRQSVALRPDHHLTVANLALTLNDQGLYEEAIAAARTAIALRPGIAQVHNCLGAALHGAGRLDDAMAAFRQAISLDPKYAEAMNNLGHALTAKGRFEEAIAACRAATELNSEFAEAHTNLGVALKATGKLDEAIAAYHQAVALKPNYAEAHNSLGNALRQRGQLDDSIAAYRQAIALRPKFAEAYSNLAVVLNGTGQLDDSIAACYQAIALNPTFAEAQNNLGAVLTATGQLDEAIAAYREAIALRPTYAEAHSNLLSTLQLHGAYDAAAIAEEQRIWSRQHAEPLRPSTGSEQGGPLGKFIAGHGNDPSPSRRLKIGYVSPDFMDQPVGRCFLPLLECHDRRQFEITCYAQVVCGDELTGQFQQHSDCWRNIVGLSDELVAKQIREDRIDVLVDLTMHAASNRLLVFVRKPAPVQVTWLAYPGSTGLTEMEYRLSDPHLDPPDTDLSCYSEKTVRLPRSFWCYRPKAAPTPPPAPAPAMKNGFVTFGCLNNFAKASPAAIDLWARILAELPDSRMIVHSNAGKHLDRAMRRFEELGVNRNRLHFVGWQPWAGYVQNYSQMDIALDPFPHGGGITTCDALWMGVPVVSLSGQTAVGRGGRSILSNLGLPELIACTPDQYVQTAIDLARDLDRMSALRQGMRERMLASPLMDAPQFARDVEAAYRQMWHDWCKTRSDAGPESRRRGTSETLSK